MPYYVLIVSFNEISQFKVDIPQFNVCAMFKLYSCNTGMGMQYCIVTDKTYICTKFYIEWLQTLYRSISNEYVEND